MWLKENPPIAVGQSDTNGALAQVLGQSYIFRGGVSSTSAVVCVRGYKLVYNNSGTTLAAGATLIEERTLGVRNGNVNTTVVAAHPDAAGIVPADFGSNTVAAGSYFLMQTSGPGKARFASTAATYIAALTSTASLALGTATTAGYAQLLSIATTAATLADLGLYLGATMAVMTNSAVVTAAGQLGDVDLRIVRL